MEDLPQCILLSRKTPGEKIETLDREEGYMFRIAKNMQRERRKAREALGLPAHDIKIDERWTEAFSIIVDKTKTDEQKVKELNEQFVIFRKED